MSEVLDRLASVLPRGARQARHREVAEKALESAKRIYADEAGEPFEAYASRTIATALLRQAGMCTRATAMDCWWTERLLGTIAGLTDGRGRAPSDDEVAAALGIALPALYSLYERHVAALMAMDLVPRSRGSAGQASTARAAYAEQALSADEQWLLACYYGDGMTLIEIAEALGVPTETVRERHGRAIAYLCARSLFGGVAGEHPAGRMMEREHGVEAVGPTASQHHRPG